LSYRTRIGMNGWSASCNDERWEGGWSKGRSSDQDESARSCSPESPGRQGVQQPAHSILSQAANHIARRIDETRTGPFHRAVDKERTDVERAINCLKQLRRVATRYEKRTVNFLAMITRAAIMVWLWFANRP